MQYKIFRKNMVIGIIVLFFGASIVEGIGSLNEFVRDRKKIDNIEEYFLINSTIASILNEKEVLFCDSRGYHIDQQQTQHGNSGYNINYDQFVAQSFKPSVERLSRVDLMLFEYGGVPDYELEFYVRKTLSGSNLVTVTKDGSEVIDGWNEFDFDDIEVEIDDTYYLVCEGDAGTGGEPFYCWYYSDSNPYSRGMTYIFNYDTWHSVSGSDCCFKTYYYNDPPNPPGNPYPSDGGINIDVNISLSWTCSDPDFDTLTYDVYLEANDSSPDVLVSNNQTGTTYNPGMLNYLTNYYWQIIAKDKFGAKTSGPVWDFKTKLEWPNNPPDKPVVNGTIKGKVGVSYIYSALSIDHEDDLLWYWFDWGDNTNTGWIGPYPSGTIASESHIWNAEGTFHIKVKAKDSFDAESLWGTLDVSMPKNRILHNSLFSWFINHFLILQMLLQKLGFQ